jgi:hypothetical protein
MPYHQGTTPDSSSVSAEPVVLSAQEQALVAAFEAGIKSLAAWAQLYVDRAAAFEHETATPSGAKSGPPEDPTADALDFDLVAQARIDDFHAQVKAIDALVVGANLLPISFASGSPAAPVARAVIAEIFALGEGPQDSGEELESLLAQISNTIEEIEALDLIDRTDLVASDTYAAACLLGAHLARGTREYNDPFFLPPWGQATFNVSVFAATLVNVLAARLASSRGVRSEVFYGANPETVSKLLTVVKAAYAVLDADDRNLIGGFDTVSRVIESSLAAMNWLTALNRADCHRLAPQIGDAFLAGLAGEPFERREEPSETGRILLRSAQKLGRELSEVNALPPESPLLFSVRVEPRGSKLPN